VPTFISESREGPVWGKTDTEVERPKATGRLVIARVYFDRPEECPRGRVEGVDLAVYKAKISDEQCRREVVFNGR
jgi:hypothetical protein